MPGNNELVCHMLGKYSYLTLKPVFGINQFWPKH